MDSVDAELRLALFTRTDLPLSFPVVVHGVPGCGKTTLLKKLLKVDHRFNIQSFGVVPPIDLAGREIIAAPAKLKEGFNFLDEYTKAENLEGFDLLIGDPLQVKGCFQKAHYVNSITRRFGRSVCLELLKLGFEIYSAKETDTEVVKANLFRHKLEGQVVCFELCIQKLLCSHSVPFLTPKDLSGFETSVVTFVTASKDLNDIISAELYLCLTRARDKLVILSPNEFNATS
uniref:TGBp1 n=1 Tax=Mentha arvensis robigovirus 1 TaxID=3077297 RepID=A0AA96HCA3_9VIRU|nr:TGBp1 [Mentha arvensis robigovirus 1]